MKPFIKWAGGKRWLLNDPSFGLPSFDGRYIEPFLGGGAVFFHLAPAQAILSDVNDRLIATYRSIRDEWQTVHARDDRVAVELGKAIVERGYSGFPCIALAPHVGANPPSYFQLAAERAGHLADPNQSAKTQQSTIALSLDHPERKTMPQLVLDMPLHLSLHLAATRPMKPAVV